MELYYGAIILYFMNYHKLGGVWFIGTHRPIQLEYIMETQTLKGRKVRDEKNIPKLANLHK